MNNPFDEFPMSERPDACRRETGYPASHLLLLFHAYASDIYVEDISQPTCFLENGEATMQHFLFYLMYKYIHVITPTFWMYVISIFLFSALRILFSHILRCTQRKSCLKQQWWFGECGKVYLIGTSADMCFQWRKDTRVSWQKLNGMIVSR